MKILYEDNHLLCVEKEANIPTQADSSGDDDLLNMLKRYVKEKYQKPGAVYLGLVHRLDRPAGGCMVFARTSKAAERLSKQMQENKWHKEYLVAACGKAENSALLEDFLLKDESTRISSVVPEGTKGAKKAILDYELLEYNEGISLLKVILQTGRHHQIRVQLANRNLPAYGDMKYNKNAKKGQQLALFCHKLSFFHPISGEKIELACEKPKYFPI